MLLRRLPMLYTFCRKKPVPHIHLKSLAPFGSQQRVVSREKTEDLEVQDEEEEFPFSDVPRPGKRWERKPYPTPMKVLIQRAKEEKRKRQENPCRVLEHPPENGLLVPELEEVAHQVYNARELLLHGLSKLVNGDSAIPVKRCQFCSEVHIGHLDHQIRSCEGPKCGSRSSTHVWRRGGIRDVVGFPYCYHLYDRVGKPRVVHKERCGVPRLQAIVELCIQAGVDLENYPAKRRTKPVYSIEGRIVDFEQEAEEDSAAKTSVKPVSLSTEVISKLNTFEEDMDMGELGSRTLKSWLDMRSGAAKLMKTYSVITCGYCPEVQVGPKGHKVRMCKAARHQFRDGLHAWQEATIDDLIRPNYVWHVRDPNGPPLYNELKRYYGKAPAIVELCVQAGAPVPIEYRSMMRLDVVPPARDEYDLVA
ncbi:APO protein 3, mitochondrial [Ananas comosus]|uniref:APO protein 3, mitochondrial n=1 Tax=Ananas comosus TaxID=4615 RepID=A0A6P5GDQ5_ANACO|nr:APO protein 3, mitochondrial [Ananas comosus]XP_020106751.1 APO protein 3, mitochondrial [Ananas comosus]XP_020106752.1 APO protein 3, mitochondrial [Ananas comosus]XP_020106753.1 APO protein 3, mitochondrial [Ananas comosus]XP_020106754.1 APO protein 3, mitochondrial [Ananas comosus]XP_020106755.1 APO protein 3, mitochondrial [Ananas comosus]XP_020106756.1 APO protein 3, mitochondrial [Ananas comosus]XP_020106757.1 APO protein 3, mitochondrial [Ananas comosus]XP_020106758.1 APO protein 